MTPDGYERIKKTLADSEIDAVITPEPLLGEDIRFLDIKTSSGQSFAEVMNALGSAGLLLDECSDDHQLPRPALGLVSNELRNPLSAPLSSWQPDRFSTFEDFRALR